MSALADTLAMMERDKPDWAMCSRCRRLAPIYFAVWDDHTGNALCWPCGHEMKVSNGRKITPWSSFYSTNP